MIMCSYRDSAEVRAVRKERDPINLITAYALEGNLVTEDELKVTLVCTYLQDALHLETQCVMQWQEKYIHFPACQWQHCTVVFYDVQDIRKDALAQVEEAVQFALEGSELPTPELYTNVYVDQGDLKIRGCDPFTWNTNTIQSMRLLSCVTES